MKKLLLTLGSAAAVVAPMATVVACGDSATSNVSYDSATETLSVTGITIGEDNVALFESLADQINVTPYNDAESIEMEITYTTKDAEDKDVVIKAKAKMTVADIANDLGFTATTLKSFFELTWDEDKNSAGTVIASKKGAPVSALGAAIIGQYHTDVAEAEAEAVIAAELTAVKTAIAALDFTSSFADGTEFTGTESTDEAEAESVFGISTTDYALLVATFDDNTWELGKISGVAEADTVELTVEVKHVTADDSTATLPIKFTTA